MVILCLEVLYSCYCRSKYQDEHYWKSLTWWQSSANLWQWATAPLLRRLHEAAGWGTRAGGVVVTLNCALHFFILLILLDVFLIRLLLIHLRHHRLLLYLLCACQLCTYGFSPCCGWCLCDKCRHLLLHGRWTWAVFTGDSGHVTGGARGAAVFMVFTTHRLLNKMAGTLSIINISVGCINLTEERD